MKISSKLICMSAVASGVLVGCGGGSSGTIDSPPTISVGMVCNPDGNAILGYGETATVTATLPGPTNATITFDVGTTDLAVWSSNTCTIVNGTSCSVSVQNLNVSGSNELGGTVQGTSYGYLSGGCKLPIFLHS